MERAAGLAYNDTPQAKLDKLDAVLTQTSTSTQHAALFAAMLSLPNDGRYPILQLEPPLRRQNTLEALISQVQALTRQKSVLMILEDAHWTDPTTLELFGRIVDRIRTLRVLLLVTFRSEFQAPWVGRPHVTALILNRLAERDIRAMIDRVVGNKLLSADIRQAIIARTDGIPLFVEEMTKALLEAGSEGLALPAAAATSPTLGVPASLQASLMARLDHLGPAKEVAQIGAAIGREFSHALLAAVMQKPAAELGAALNSLTSAGLLFRQGVPPHASYLFKHALVQDAAYGTLLREPRRALHARIAAILESQFTEIAENQPGLLAHHFTQAGMTAAAVEWWSKAGQRSLEQSALVEAIEQLTRALRQIATLPSTPTLRSQEIKLQVALINPLQHIKGYAATETRAAAERARLLIEQAEALGEPPEDSLLLYSILHGFFSASFVVFNGDVTLELAAQFLTLAEKQGAAVPLMLGHRMMGSCMLFTGNFAASRAHFDQARKLYDRADHRPLATRFGIDHAVSVSANRSWAGWFLGYPKAALIDANHAITKARNIGQAATLMTALYWTSLSQLLCGDYAAANALADELVALADEKGSSFWKALGMIAQGRALGLMGTVSNAVQMTTCGLAAHRSNGATIGGPSHLSYLARANGELGQFDDAWRCIGEALRAMETTKETWFEAEINRVAGEIALKSLSPDAAKAEAYFERALTVAREQQAKSWELRAAMSMARLWRDQGNRDEARDLLAPVYGWFTEGFDTLDLKEAKALLDELAA
jgi:predicted ATPase